MTTTRIRLPEALKARVNEVAQRSGMTPHAYILDAIAEKTAESERQANFDAEAEQRYVKVVATGETIPWAEMRAYLEARVAGDSLAKPIPRVKTG